MPSGFITARVDRARLLAGPLLSMVAVGATARVGWAQGMAWLLPLWIAAGVGWAFAASGLRSAEGRGVLVAILLGAVGLRACALLGDPGLSDDRHRYVWEGGLILEGKSPWAFAPASDERASERQRWSALFARINHPEVSAAYPPLTQAAAAGVVWAAGGVGSGEDAGRRAGLGMRLFFGCADLLVLLPLAMLLRLRGRPLGGLAWWAWSPLVALEFSGSGHFDSLGVFLLVLAILGFESAASIEAGGSESLRRRGERTGWLALVAAFFVKFLPAPLFLFALRQSHQRLRAIVLASIASALICAPLLGLDGGFGGVTRGLSEYAARWEAGSLVFRHVEPLFEAFGDRDGSWSDPRRLARLSIGGVFLVVLLFAWLRKVSFARAAFVSIGAFLVLTPTLHPWYLCWLLPLLALFPSRAWTWLAVVAPLFYWPVQLWQREAIWHEPAWVWPVIAFPFLGLFALELAQALPDRSKKRGPGAS